MRFQASLVRIFFFSLSQNYRAGDLRQAPGPGLALLLKRRQGHRLRPGRREHRGI